MVDWGTLANVATAGGTALLAVSTFSSTRSANAAARSAERGLLDGLRPILVPTRWNDPVEKVRFADGRWLAVPGGRAVLEVTDEAVYLVISLRNVGRGVGVLHGWDVLVDPMGPHGDPADFHMLTRDIYVAPGDGGFCQVALRDPGADQFAQLTERSKDGQPFSIDVLYGDTEGGQRMITRLGLSHHPSQDTEDNAWAVSAGRHFNVDRADPR
jgi:hypothetical protein